MPSSSPVTSNRQHLSSDDCLEVRREDNQNYSVLCCVQQLCTMMCTHTCEQFLNLLVGIALDFIFVFV